SAGEKCGLDSTATTVTATRLAAISGPERRSARESTSRRGCSSNPATAAATASAAGATGPSSHRTGTFRLRGAGVRVGADLADRADHAPVRDVPERRHLRSLAPL